MIMVMANKYKNINVAFRPARAQIGLDIRSICSVLTVRSLNFLQAKDNQTGQRPGLVRVCAELLPCNDVGQVGTIAVI